jgi:predicted PurR-regulated permease PerM
MRLAGSLLYGPDTLWLLGLLFTAGLLLVRARHAWLGTLGELLQRLTTILMMLLLFVVTTPLVVEIAHESGLIRSQYDATSRELSKARDKLEEMNLEIESSIGKKINHFIEQAENIADDISRQVVIRIAVFVLETLLIPLACLWITASVITREYKGQSIMRNDGPF